MPSQDKPLNDVILRIDAASSLENLRHKFIPLAGAAPEELPFWKDLSEKDVRGLPPMTIRYQSELETETCPLDLHDTVRQMIWRRLEELLPEENMDNVLPSIVFDESLRVKDRRRATIDLIFDSSDSLRKFCGVYKGMPELHIYGSGNTTHKYLLSACTNSLDGSVFTFECVGLPLDNVDHDVLFESLQVVTAPAGSLLGFGKVVSNTKHGLKEDGVLRAYLKLRQEHMMRPFKELVRLLPTHLRWEGVPRTLCYAGRHLHDKDVVSPNFPAPCETETESSPAHTKRKEGTSDASSSSKKRRNEK